MSGIDSVERLCHLFSIRCLRNWKLRLTTSTKWLNISAQVREAHPGCVLGEYFESAGKDLQGKTTIQDMFQPRKLQPTPYVGLDRRAFTSFCVVLLD